MSVECIHVSYLSELVVIRDIDCHDHCISIFRMHPFNGSQSSDGKQVGTVQEQLKHG